MAAGGGGGMIRTFRRAVRAGAAGATRDSFSHSSTSSSYTPISSSWPSALSITKTDDLDWVSVNESGDEIEEGFDLSDDRVFGEVPSEGEVLNAVSALQLIINPTHYPHFFEDNRIYNLESIEAQENGTPNRLLSRVSSFGSESDWMEPSLHLCYPRMLDHHASIRLYDAFHLLRTEPSIKRMVVSLSSDKAVWEAVLNNEVVKELRDSLSEVESKIPQDRDDPENVMSLFSWVYEKAKVKVIEIIDKIAKLANELFQFSKDEETEESGSVKTEEILQISLFLSIMVLVIVVLDRSYGAWP